jgi:phospholipase C
LKSLVTLALLAALSVLTACSGPSNGGIYKVNHVIVVMMENHSFDNYLGAIAYAPGTPYHSSSTGCAPSDHACVDGLTCSPDSTGNLSCTNSNLDDDGTVVKAFHASSRCVAPDLDHSWFQSHREANYSDPNATLLASLSDGFVRVNDTTEQLDNGVETATDDQTMSFFTQDDLPFYYDLAQKFAIDDRYFASVMGPTFPNRSYLMAATSFGHVTTNDEIPPPGGYKPIAGTLFDLLDGAQVSWADYSQTIAQGFSFRPSAGSGTDPQFPSLGTFLAQAAGMPGAAQLPQVSFVDPSFGGSDENDEHPPTDIQRGQAFVSKVINAVRNGPYWRDSVIFITWDEHGGFYDHVQPPQAPQGSARTPDGISPGQCADLSNPPVSEQPGGGAQCATNPLSTTDTSVRDAELLCPALAGNPTGPYPSGCASFDQLGFRVPLLAISPFTKPHYVSHTIGDHTSLLAFIEQRFLAGGGPQHPHLTQRDQSADVLDDMFDFDNAPSLETPVGQAQPPTLDCTPTS